MYITAGETGGVKSSRHFQLTIDTLLTQNCDFGPYAGSNHRRSRVLFNIKGKRRLYAGIAAVQQRGKFLFRTLGIVAQRLHLVTGFRPGTLQVHALVIKHRFARVGENNMVIVTQAPDDVTVFAQTRLAQCFQYGIGIAMPHLQHGTQLFAEQNGALVIAQIVQVCFKPAVAGEAHLTQGGEQAAV